MRAPRLQNLGKRLRDREQRGAALVEFAIAIPILIALLVLVFDAGLGFTAARSSASAARSAARVGALAGDDRLADYRALDALKAQYGNGEAVDLIQIYFSPTSNTLGVPPDTCNAATLCNEYTGAALNGLAEAQFATDAADPTACASSAPDAAWCPLGREAQRDGSLGVFVSSTSEPTIGALSPQDKTFEIEDRAVFALYFTPIPPTPTAVTP